MHTIYRAAAFFLFFIFVSIAWGAAERPEVTLRVFVETGVRGVATTQAFPVSIGNKKIMVKNPPVLSESDILAVNFSPSRSGRGDMAVLKLSNTAGRNLELETRNNQGRELVVLYNQRLLYAAPIDTVLSKGALVIPQGFGPQMKKNLEKMIEYNRRARKLDGT